MTWPSNSSESRSTASAPSGGWSKVVLAVFMSSPPREREDGHDDHDEPHHCHPPRGVEPPEVHASARHRPDMEPAPAAPVGGVDLIFTQVRHDAASRPVRPGPSGSELSHS